MASVQHPAFPDDAPLPVENPDEWVEQGWVLIDKMPKVETPGDAAPMPQVGLPEGSPPPVPMPQASASEAPARSRK